MRTRPCYHGSKGPWTNTLALIASSVALSATPIQADNAPSPAFNGLLTVKTNNMDCTLGEVTIQAPPKDSGEWPNITIPFCFTENGVVLTNWKALTIDLRDPDGNWAMPRRTNNIIDGWMVYSASARRIDPKKVWRLRASFISQPVASTNLYTVRIPIPLDSDSVMRTNLAGLPLEIKFDTAFMLMVSALEKRPETAVTLVRLTDEDGNNIDEGTGAWNQFFFRESVRHLVPGSMVVVTLAIQRNVPLEFEFRPKVIMSP